MHPTGRVILIILDGLGIGALPDAGDYGDAGSDTLGHIAESVGGIHLPNLEKMGLGCLGSFQGVRPVSNPSGYFGRMAERSAGKDTIIGHWEMMGVVTEVPFPTYPEGFPPEIIAPFEAAVGQKVLGNCVASGTEIIETLGARHLKTGSPVVYTSADSVFQVAAHEEIISPTDLYDICLTARRLLSPPHHVARVIARPFVGEPGRFKRTDRRRDFSLPPPSITLLDRLEERAIPVIGIGKIEDIFSGKGISEAIHTHGNEDGIDQTISSLDRMGSGLVFTNLVDFDMLYGHRNDPRGYAEALRVFDRRLPEIVSKMREDDWLVITADHGNDPLFPGTDHTREHVPLLMAQRERGLGKDVGTRGSFSDLGQTLAEFFQVPPLLFGESFLPLMG